MSDQPGTPSTPESDYIAPICCAEPMVLYQHVAWECAAAYNLLLEEGAVADDGASPPTWVGDEDALSGPCSDAIRERFNHLLATRLLIDEDDPRGVRPASDSGEGYDYGNTSLDRPCACGGGSYVGSGFEAHEPGCPHAWKMPGLPRGLCG